MTLPSELREAVAVLTSLSLPLAARFCAEMLAAVPAPAFTPPHVSRFTPQRTAAETAEHDAIALATAYLGTREHELAVALLRDCSLTKARFLRLHAQWLANCAREDAAAGTAILAELESAEVVAGPESPAYAPLLLYLQGVVLVAQKRSAEAIPLLLDAVTDFPCNWLAWQELAAAIDLPAAAQTVVEAVQGRLGDHAMAACFMVQVAQEFTPRAAELDLRLGSLQTQFPLLAFLQVQRALVQYHALDYAAAEETFDRLLEQHPLRLDDLDTYLNILYVMNKTSKLSHLAQHAALVDRFRPETCCVIANYYLLIFEHEKAIMYYRRALALNPKALAAWTLMGHEFVELKNLHAAIELYRRALDASPKDFRAWYGLGQAYEVLEMHLYLLYYYQQAARLNPTDKRMWQAVANCFEKLQRIGDAIKALERAVAVSPEGDESIAGFWLKAATLSEEQMQHEQAREYMRLCMRQEEHGGGEETTRARLWLARAALRDGDTRVAYELAMGVGGDMGVEAVDEARALARQCRR